MQRIARKKCCLIIFLGRKTKKGNLPYMFVVSIIDAGCPSQDLPELEGLSGRYLSIGTLERGLILGGTARDDNNVCVVDHHICFPKGIILTIIFRDGKGNERFIDISEDEIFRLIRGIEKGKCYKSCKEIKKHEEEILEAYQGVDTFVVYLTDSGEFLTMHLHTAGAGWHEFEVLSDENDDEKLIFYQKENVRRVEIFSQDLCEVVSRYVF